MNGLNILNHIFHRPVNIKVFVSAAAVIAEITLEWASPAGADHIGIQLNIIQK